MVGQRDKAGRQGAVLGWSEVTQMDRNGWT